MSVKKWRGNTERHRGMKPIKVKQPPPSQACVCESSASRKCICGHVEDNRIKGEK